MFSAALYAHARTLLPIAHEIAGAARIRHSLRPLTIEGVRIPASLGRNASRDRGRIFGVVLAHAGTQYSRGVNDRAEKPRRTGSPAFAEDDRLTCGWAAVPPPAWLMPSPMLGGTMRNW